MNSHEAKQRLTHAVHISLMSGIYGSASILIVGIALILIKGDEVQASRRPKPAEVYANLMQGDPVAIVYLGLFLLMLTPVARVIVLGVGWFIEKDYRFALTATAVFALLVTSLFLGHA